MSFVLNRNRSRGASLIEVLVVIVIFAVGILSVVQLFPRGLSVLKTSKNISVANQLARSEMERLKGQTEQIPEAILAVNPSATSFSLDIDRAALLSDALPSGTTGVTAGGVVVSPFGGVNWKFATGANRFRTIIGEGRTIPAPRFIPQTNGGTLYGGLMVLQFAPIERKTAGSSVLVYGNDMQRVFVDEAPNWFRDGQAVIVDEDNLLYLPVGTARNRQYRMTLTYYTTVAGRRESRSIVVVLDAPALSPRAGYRAYSLTDLIQADFGDTAEWIDYDTLRIQRIFLEVPANGFSTPGVGGITQQDSAYEFRLLDPDLGVLLFNPAGYNLFEFRNRGRVALRARVDYNVIDWRVIRDDFRAPDAAPFQQKLILGSLKVKGEQDIDLSPYQGIPISLTVDGGGTETRDLILLDSDTGGLVQPNSYRVDKSVGLISFLDLDSDLNTGLSLDVIFPGDTQVTRIDQAGNRPMRALYMGKGEWAVQPIKGSSIYRATYGPNVSYDQCYPGGANGVDGDGNHIYFPLADVGKKVIIGEIWYREGGNPANPLLVLEDQEFIIRAPRVGGLRLGYVDIRDRISGNPFLDFSQGYAVRRVRGVSMSVRVTWGAGSIKLGPDENENLSELSKWFSDLKRVQTETFLTQGSEDL